MPDIAPYTLSLRIALMVPVAAALSAGAAEKPSWSHVEAALEAGNIHAAESLFTMAEGAPPGTGFRHRREILMARLAASRGDWKGAESRLRAWKSNPSRLEGSGEVLFWLGWAALHQARITDADSLFVLASAYSGEDRAQEALEYRFAALLENSPSLQDYLRGLPESPLPEALRRASLERVPESSRLHPHALWQLAMMQEGRGSPLAAREILHKLARDATSLPGRRAIAYLGFLAEDSSSASALAAYEGLLLKHQNGVVPEFARKRMEGPGIASTESSGLPRLATSRAKPGE
jgi:hypothetical protein